MLPITAGWHGAPHGPNSPWALQGITPAAADRYVSGQSMSPMGMTQAPYMGVSAALTPNALAGYTPGAMTGAPQGAFSLGPSQAPTPQQAQLPPPPPPAPISPLLAMAMQQQMGAAQPQSQGMGMPQGQPIPSGGQYQNFIPPIQATPFNYQGGQQPLPIGGMWNQVAQQMAGPGFMQPGTSAMYSGFNPALVAPPQGPHNIAAPASTSTGAGIANLGNLGLVNSLYSPYSGGVA